MAKKNNRPSGGRPPGRIGRGGVGPPSGMVPGNQNTGGTKHQGGCCPMVAAARAARRGKYKLASRYARWSVRLIAERMA